MLSGTLSGVLSAAPVAVLGSWCGSPLTSHFRIGFPIRTPLLSGEPEDRSWWMPCGVGSGSSERDRPLVWKSRNAERAWARRVRVLIAGRVRDWATSFALDRWFRLRCGEKPMRATAVVDPGLPLVRISAESKALELRGIVTSWSSEQEHAMSETA